MKSFAGIGQDVKITPKFTYYLPKNEKEEVESLGVAKDKGLNSDETLTRLSPFTTDAESELEKLKEEKDAAAQELAAQQKPTIPLAVAQ